ncbi:MAG: hypothetical protein ACREM2_10835 [Vulcanimicrobiaceae bacterium]
MPRQRLSCASRPPRDPLAIAFSDFGGLPLLAEYDAEAAAIRINRGAVLALAHANGPAEAASFVAAAIVHERFHRDHPGASEARAHAAVREQLGLEPRELEAALALVLPCG